MISRLIATITLFMIMTIASAMPTFNIGQTVVKVSIGDRSMTEAATYLQEQAKALKYNAEAALAQATKEKLDLDFVEQAKGVKQEREKELASHKGKKINA